MSEPGSRVVFEADVNRGDLKDRQKKGRHRNRGKEERKKQKARQRQRAGTREHVTWSVRVWGGTRKGCGDNG